MGVAECPAYSQPPPIVTGASRNRLLQQENLIVASKRKVASQPSRITIPVGPVVGARLSISVAKEWICGAPRLGDLV